MYYIIFLHILVLIYALIIYKRTPEGKYNVLIGKLIK